MAGQKGSMMSVRTDVKVIDCTLRDGGIANRFMFDDDFVRALYKMNVAAGIDYMEFGYKSSKNIFSVDDYGKWKFCDEQHIREIVGENDTPLKLSVMADVGRTELEDIPQKSDSVVDMIRTAAYINQIPTCISMVEDFNKKGYETTANIMAISTANERDIDQALELLGNSPVDAIYLVDSFGALYPEDIRRLTDKYVEAGEKYGKIIGIHAHDNQKLAFANTIESMTFGTSYLDATVSSMGRGAGNCSIENLLGFLKNPKYRLTPVLKFVENYIIPLRESGVKWGYDIQYLLTGRLNCHPSSAIEFTRAGRTDYANFHTELLEKE